MCNIAAKQVRLYMGDGWRLDFNKTHFDSYSPPDFYARVRINGDMNLFLLRNSPGIWLLEMHCCEGTFGNNSPVFLEDIHVSCLVMKYPNRGSPD